MKHSGTVVLIGRPNTGKSTLLNSILGTKVAITTPKPQTTRFSIQAVLNDDRGQIVFIDTPGIFEKASASVISITNRKTYQVLNEEVDVVLYLVDKSRPKGKEENINSKKFIEEIIREKVFLNTRDEVPYAITTEVEEVKERDNGNLYIKAAVLVSDKRYKGMIIGKNGRVIKEIGQAVRKELEVSSNKKVYVDLRVEVDSHWIERLT